MNNLKLAIQKSGRLQQESLRLLKDCGIAIDNGKDQLKIVVPNFPMEILYLRNSDIPQYIKDGTVDIAIIGSNTIEEKAKDLPIVEKLGFAKCRLSLAVPKSEEVADLSFFQNKKIATSYPNTLKSYLDENRIKAEIHTISGSVEIAPNIGLADGICDLVSSGSTLFKNGLVETSIVLKSEAVLASSANLTSQKQEILDKLLFRIRALLRARKQKYILMNVPNEKIQNITEILPVLKSPTIMPLAEEGWSSLHSVIEENKFWSVIDDLKAAGAEGILIIPINKMVL